MFEIDEFIKDCQAALRENEPRKAIRELLTRTVSDSSTVADALEHQRAGLTVLHNQPDLTVLNVVWGPHMVLPAHDHRMWAAIGIYAGQEDNTFFRRDGNTVAGSGGKEVREREVLFLGDDAIHGVTNPLGSYTGAIHVYGGDFVRAERSVWPPETLVEQPWNMEYFQSIFEASNSAADP